MEDFFISFFFPKIVTDQVFLDTKKKVTLCRGACHFLLPCWYSELKVFLAFYFHKVSK